MQKELLQQYCDIRQEIKDLKNRIDKIERRTHTTVKGSSHSYPYTQKTYHIEGVNPNMDTKTIQRLRMSKLRYEILCDELLEKQTEVEEWINLIPDSRTRMIFRYRYIDDLNWIQVAYRMGGRNTADSCRMIHDRFLEKN